MEQINILTINGEQETAVAYSCKDTAIFVGYSNNSNGLVFEIKTIELVGELENHSELTPEIVNDTSIKLSDYLGNDFYLDVNYLESVGECEIDYFSFEGKKLSEMEISEELYKDIYDLKDDLIQLRLKHWEDYDPSDFDDRV